MKLNNLIITAIAGFSMILSGCQKNDENEQHYDNKLFISASNFTKEILFKAGDMNVETSLSVAIAKPEGRDIKVTMSPAPELLSTYKLAYYDDSAVLLPEEHYSMPETSTTIQSGSIVSPELPIEFINTGNLDINTTYVLPVTIKSVEGIGVLQSAKTYYYVFRGASLINVVCNISRNRAYPDFNNDSKFNNLTQNTMEILFKANSFPNTLNTLMGIEGHYLLRIGDANIPSNQLQVASTNSCTSADLQLESNKWYHVAVTFDRGNVKVYINGIEKASGSVGKSSISLGAKHTNEEDGSRCFWIGYSYKDDRYFDGAVSEARIWNRVLTAEEIQATNHFYAVDSDSNGLIAYWKLDEGSGTVAKDYSVSGYDLTIEKEPKWESVSLPQ
jgi:hypothetical protein